MTWYDGGNSPVKNQDESGINSRTLTVFEPSPLNRVMESFAPGKSWEGTSGSPTETAHHSTKQKYWTNTATDNVKYWAVSFAASSGAGFGSYTTPKTYAAGTLYKNVTEDEQNRQVIEFKDKEGQVILKKVQLSKTDAGTGSPHSGWLCTYYLYDDLGNLRCVVQPEGVKLLEANSWNFTSNILKEQCFRYEYDSRNRMIIKQVPGAGPVYMVYDIRDRQVMTMNQYGLKTASTSAAIDKLTYYYTPGTNKLLNVADAVNDPNSTLGDFKYPTAAKTATTVDITFDGNGNIITDQNKKITGITYNILNLPSQIAVAGKGAIKYYYDASGNKLQKCTTDNTASPGKATVTTYIGSAVYINDTLQFFGTHEGRVRANDANTAWIYDYFLKDHLGNTRMMITDDYNVTSPILVAYSYYPLGLQQKGIGLIANNSLVNKLRFFGKEIQEREFNDGSGLDWYDYGMRE